jgi:hypothetical protein
MFEDKTDLELYQSLVAELAKATAELRTAQSDLEKANSRQKFSLMLLNKLIERNKD